jgi:DNA-binding LacI/PurR family transcriptional regulator
MPVSIKDIAKEAGVSPSTVSRALHDHPRISSETKTYIQNLAKSMGYVPSTVARNLVGKRTATIGVAMTDLTDPYYDRLMSGIEDGAAAHGYQLVLSSFYRNPERELAIIHDFHKRRMDGIIVTGSAAVQAYQSSEHNFFMPIVLVNNPHYPFSVSTNGYMGAKQVVKHLTALGHRRIAYVNWGTEHIDGANRLSGYQSALAEYNVPFDKTLVVSGDGGITGGIKAVPNLFDLSQPPTAIFAFNDMTAIGVINALRQRNLEVPHDVSVAGYDDLEMASYYYPPLTTVRQPTYQVGKRAVNMLLRLTDGHSVEPEILEPELVVRDSTGPVRPGLSSI